MCINRKMDKEAVVPPCTGMQLSNGSEPAIATHNSDDSHRHNGEQKKPNAHSGIDLYTVQQQARQSFVLEVRILVTLEGVTGRWHRTAGGEGTGNVL